MSDEENYSLFRDCLSTTLLDNISTDAAAKPKRRRRAKRNSVSGSTSDDAPANEPGNEQKDIEELADFIDYLATEIFENLPEKLQGLEYRSWRDDEKLQEQYALPLTKGSLSQLNLPVAITETLETYNLVASEDDSSKSSTLPSSVEAFLLPILNSYLTTLTTPPRATVTTRSDVEACEICGRWWINLSYHHLIPRFVHDKVLKKGWHKKEDLQNVAWICGACHRFVHKFRGHEDLARDYYTVELLLEAEEVQRFAAWVGKLRWKKK